MTFRLTDASGNLLIHSPGSYLVWQFESATGSMSLALSAPSMTLARSAPSVSFAVSSPSITLSTSED